MNPRLFTTEDKRKMLERANARINVRVSSETPVVPAIIVTPPSPR